MNLDELKEKINRITEPDTNWPPAPLHGRTVKLRVNNKDGFVWIEAELTSVEEFTDAPDVVLVATLSRDAETDFMHVLGTAE